MLVWWFWTRLIEGVWFSLTRPLPLWIPAFAGMTVGTSGMTWVRRAYPASIASLVRAPFAGAKGQIRLFRNHRRVGWDRLR